MNNSLRPSIHYLNELLLKQNIKLNQNQLELLWKYHKLLRASNKDRDLTRLFKFETIVTKHYVDCLMVPKLTDISGPLLDIGTGAGFPGIPIKIACPNIDLVLAEHRPRRVAFLELVIKNLGLKRIKIYPHKVIKESKILNEYNDEYNNKYNSVITRALETIPLTLTRVQDKLCPEGNVIFMKGPNCEQEIREAKNASPLFKLVNDFHYSISQQDKRRLIIYKYKA
jgi:16S rRNA (guanine(527)-N(7))-methyltransferase RsmG